LVIIKASKIKSTYSNVAELLQAEEATPLSSQISLEVSGPASSSKMAPKQLNVSFSDTNEEKLDESQTKQTSNRKSRKSEKQSEVSEVEKSQIPDTLPKNTAQRQTVLSNSKSHSQSPSNSTRSSSRQLKSSLLAPKIMVTGMNLNNKEKQVKMN
jgi:2-succinyl-5-enolpyruvyl-6-hydroxy-3-cyclohexene-1-carboxylate synthase